MLQKIKNKLLILASTIMFALPLAVPVAVHAQDITGNLCSGTNFDLTGNSQDCATNADESSFNNTLRRIVNILSAIIGVIAVIMIIFGGLRYITSGGDSTKVGNAKNTIIYALIGLIIVALAQVIVRFVLNNADTAAS